LENEGVPLDPSQIDGGLLLGYAAMKNNPKKVEELLLAGIDPNAQDAKGRTALIRAISNKEIVHMLLENNADPNIPDKDGETPLCYAAMQGEVESVEKLLKNGANANPPRGAKSLLTQIRELKSKVLWPLSGAYKKITLLLANADSTPTQPNLRPNRLQWAEFLPTKHSPLIESLQNGQTIENICETIDEIIAAFMKCGRGISMTEKRDLARALQNPIIQAIKDKPGLQALFDLAK
jgi:ankyrin repeat protein